MMTLLYTREFWIVEIPALDLESGVYSQTLLVLAS